jgi:hypothetical protein
VLGEDSKKGDVPYALGRRMLNIYYLNIWKRESVCWGEGENCYAVNDSV